MGFPQLVWYSEQISANIIILEKPTLHVIDRDTMADSANS